MGMEVGEQGKSAGVKRVCLSACVFAAFLQKLAKHLAFIACLMIIGAASGRFGQTEIGIFLIVVAAAVLHSIGRVLASRYPASLRLPGSGP
jgi:hypothetical protein